MDGDSKGIDVARSGVVARRITALIGMVALVALLVILVWRVYLHHEHGTPEDEPAVVALHARSA